MRRPRAVITGGAGFLGSHLCERLLLQGHEVLCIDNLLTGTEANLIPLREMGPLQVYFRDAHEFLPIPGTIDLVVHLASPASPADYLRFPIETLKAGSFGTLHTLELAREKGSKYILASSSEVYGDPLVHPQTESYWGNVNPVGERSPYDESKRFAEALTVAYRSIHRVEASIVRVFNTYGPRMRPDDGRAIPTFITQALTGSPLTVTGDGSQTRSPCYVDDLISGICQVVGTRTAGPVNLGNPEEISVLALAQRILELADSAAPIRLIDRPADDPQVRQPDISLARSALGWAPTVTIEDGLRKTIAWFRGVFGETIGTGCIGPVDTLTNGQFVPTQGRKAILDG
jgi:dTDP-glucose 4,6-dehydratase